jgi:hypothetical protein
MPLTISIEHNWKNPQPSTLNDATAPDTCSVISLTVLKIHWIRIPLGPTLPSRENQDDIAEIFEFIFTERQRLYVTGEVPVTKPEWQRGYAADCRSA